MSRSVAVLGGGKDSLAILRRIKEMGLYTLVFDSDAHAPARKYLADHFVNISCYDAWEVLRYFKLQTLWQPSAVLCAGTDCPDVMAILNKHFSLAGPKAHTAHISMNKIVQRRLLEDAGVNIPHPWSAGKTGKWMQPLTDRIIKPASSRGSRGVRRLCIHPPEGKLAGFLPILVDEAAEHDPRGQVIIEKWIDGVQLSSESLVQDGKIIYTAYSQRNYSMLEETYPHVIEDGGDMPPDIVPCFEIDYRQKAQIQLQKCVDILGLTCGTLKGDLVWDDHRIWVIEVATRLSGGEFCSEQIPRVWGVDFVGYAVRLALGEHIYPGEINPYFRRYMAQRFVIPEGTRSHPERGKGFIKYGSTREAAVLAAEESVKHELRNMR